MARKTTSMGWRVIRRTGGWYIVSSMYREASPGNIGGGSIIATPHKTREAARAELRLLKQREGK